MLKISCLVVLALLFVGLFFYYKRQKNQITSVPFEAEPTPITFGQIYNHYKENGYLKSCKKEHYKFSEPRLLKILNQSEELKNMDIHHITKAKNIPDVGKKVFSLISHLTLKYQTEVI